MGSDGFELAGTTVHIPPMGVGTWAWGDEKTWGGGTEATEDTILPTLGFRCCDDDGP